MRLHFRCYTNLGLLDLASEYRPIDRALRRAVRRGALSGMRPYWSVAVLSDGEPLGEVDLVAVVPFRTWLRLLDFREDLDEESVLRRERGARLLASAFRLWFGSTRFGVLWWSYSVVAGDPPDDASALRRRGISVHSLDDLGGEVLQVPHTEEPGGAPGGGEGPEGGGRPPGRRGEGPGRKPLKEGPRPGPG